MTDSTLRATRLPVLDRLRVDAMAYPSHGAGQIRDVLTTTLDNGLRADLLVLLAETYQRQGLIRAAVETITAAHHLQPRLPPHDTGLLAMLAVSADLAVVDAHPDAVSACGRYLDAAIQATSSNTRRVLHADALHAVAVYHHHSRVRGRTQLAMLTELLPASDGVAVMIRHGLAAMHPDGNPGCHMPLAGPTPVLPGGQYRPDLDTPPVDYLANRITKHPPAPRRPAPV